MVGEARRELNVRENAYAYVNGTKKIVNNIVIKANFQVDAVDDESSSSSSSLNLESVIQERVRGTITRLQHKHPLLRSRLAIASNPCRYVFEDLTSPTAPTTPIPLKFIRLDAGDDIEKAAVKESIQLLEVGLNLEKELWSVTILISPITDSSATITLLLCLSHLGFDGKAALVVFQDFITFLCDASTPDVAVAEGTKHIDSIVPLETTGPSLTPLNSTGDRLVLIGFFLKVIIALFWLYWYQIALITTPKKAYPVTPNERVRLIYAKLDAAKTSKLIALCKQNGVSITSFLSAACALSVIQASKEEGSPATKAKLTSKTHISNDATMGVLAVDLRSRLNIKDEIDGSCNSLILLPDLPPFFPPKDWGLLWKRAARVQKQISQSLDSGDVFRNLHFIAQPSEFNQPPQLEPTFYSLSRTERLTYVVSNLGQCKIQASSPGQKQLRVSKSTDVFITSTPSTTRLGTVEVTTMTTNGELGLAITSVEPVSSSTLLKFTNYLLDWLNIDE